MAGGLGEKGEEGKREKERGNSRKGKGDKRGEKNEG